MPNVGEKEPLPIYTTATEAQIGLRIQEMWWGP